MNKKIYIETLGCPKNFNDTEVFSAILENNDYIIVDEPSDSDIIIVNTCGFINDAKRESIDKIFEMASYNKKLVVSGCLSERYHKELMEEMPEVSLFLGVNDYNKLPEFLENLENQVDGVSSKWTKFVPLQDRKLPEIHYSETLKIAEGCNNKCAYCIIPTIRGGYRSKKIEDIIIEAKELVKKGVKELILIAQDVTNYGMDLYGKYELPRLLTEICKIEDLMWIRLMYCYEDRITDELIDVIKNEPKICKYIDIPIQHSSDRVLNSMKRRSTNKSIINTINRLKEAIPSIRIRTTLIVGFPGETDDDFDNLIDFISQQKFARLGAFSYSQEEGTAAFGMDNQIDEDIKKIRLDKVMEVQRDISLELNKEFIGRTLKVLVEGEDSDGSYFGRSEYDAPEIDNSVLFTSKKKLNPGDFIDVKIIDAFDYDLVGEA